MKDFNRRDWLKTAGLASTFAFTGGINAFCSDANTAESIDLQTDDLIQLNANENPFGPSAKVRQAMSDVFSKACRYPFRYHMELVRMLAVKEGVSPDHIVLTAGSTEGLRITGLTYGMSGGEIIAADPTFQALMRYAERFGAKIHRVPLDGDLQHDLRAMESKINGNTKLMYICNPNNPTGSLIPAEQLKSFCTEVSKKTLVFSDEAYYDFIEEPNYPSMVELVKEGKDVVVTKTFSKVYGLAGIRIGYLIAKPEIAQKIEMRTVANVNVLGIYAALAALKDQQFYQESLKRNKQGKNLIYQTLDELNLVYAKSHTNFVFFNSGMDISKLQTKMRQQGVEIGRPFPPLRDWCRISTGRIQDVEVFTNGLKKVLS